MIQVQTELQVADNTGAKRVECIKVLGGSKRRYAGVGDLIVVSVKDALPNGKVKKGSVHKAVIVRTKKEIFRKDGSKVHLEINEWNCEFELFYSRVPSAWSRNQAKEKSFRFRSG